ncbi:hypothetical protein CU669_01570 [Paramagnetospirillum kuznetsovii]|uniref:F5/8 type C domain-containing protein n=1 Tax=Paramagnetospirillum kuznetsovii TaxID=2053833 RepID=A0A364P3B2_9PROT|nr:discoidin domain-containing protein [Paramagnetospirillum kuznetsovii]RAU23804.1 hypothetical protein CU669_01570 [Paramagnetospirillum kuznetsovii]
MTDHIQVGDAAPRIQYAASGSQTAFTFPFPVFTAADLEVWLDQTRQTTPAYSISGVGISSGGTVLFAAPPVPGALVTLRRRLSIARTSDYQEDGIIRAKVLNDELDYQTAALQQVAEDVGRAAKRSFLSASSADLTLPEPEPGKAIGWNADGSGLTNDPAEFAACTATVTAQAAQAAASAATASTQAATAQASATQAFGYKIACDADAIATASDRAAVVLDKAIVAADQATVASDKLATASSAAAAATARTACDADAAATAADRAAVAADKATVATNTAAAAASAAAAAGSATTAHASEVAAAASAAVASAAASGGAVKVSGSDTTSAYLSNTLTAGSNIALTVLNPGADESLRISVTGLATVAASGAYTDLSGRPNLGTASPLDVDTDTTLAANSDSRLASQKAVKAYVAANSGPDLTPDVGQLYLAVARLDTPTSPNVGGTQVADEFDAASGIASLGGGTVSSGYLSNPGSTSMIAQATGTAIGDMTGGGGLAGAFDGVTSQSVTASATKSSATNSYIGKNLGTGHRIASGIYYVPADGNMVAGPTASTVYLQGSNDGSSWTTLGSADGAVTYPTSVTVTSGDTATAYSYVRLYVVPTVSGSEIRCAEARFYEVANPPNMTVASNAYTAQSAPSTLSLVAEYQDISGTAVINTDITFEVSRDNGTTWTAVTMTDFGPSPISGARVLKGSASAAGQPSGTSLKWRIKTFNTKEQRVHGLWMQWK